MGRVKSNISELKARGHLQAEEIACSVCKAMPGMPCGYFPEGARVGGSFVHYRRLSDVLRMTPLEIAVRKVVRR